MELRIIHFSDTHLGFSDYGKFDSESGIYQREMDVYKVFREIIDYIIKTKPDLVIHAGDLFDSIRPPNRAIAEAMTQFWRLSQAKIPTIVIAGNHSTPRQRSTDSIFKVLKYFSGIQTASDGRYEKIVVGECAIHAVPHMYSDEDLKAGLSQLRPDKNFKYNIMVAHASVSDTEDASSGEFKDQVIPKEALNPDFDYIALGHYHRHLKVTENAYYSGSPERFSFREEKDKKGFLEINLTNHSVNFIPTNARQMITFPPIDCSNRSATEILHEFESTISLGVSGKIIKVVFDNIPKHVHSSLDLQKIREMVKEALHYEPAYNWKAESGNGDTSTAKIGSLNEEFQSFLESKFVVQDKETEELKNLGLDYLSKIIEEEEGVE